METSHSLGTAPRDLGPAEGGVPEVSPPSTGPLTPIAPARLEQGLSWLLCVHGRGPERCCAGGPPGGTLCEISSDRQCNQGWPVRTGPPPHTSILRPPPAGSAHWRPPGQATHLGHPPARRPVCLPALGSFHPVPARPGRASSPGSRKTKAREVGGTGGVQPGQVL